MPDTMIPEAVVLVTESLEGDAVPRWARLIVDAAQMRPGRLVVDLRGAERIDETAVVMLLSAHRYVTSARRRLVLRNLTPRVRSMLSHGRVDSVLEIEEGLTVPADSPHGLVDV